MATDFYCCVAHNKIAGTIPKCIEHQSFLELDLSYNKITGTYDFENDMAGMTSKTLEVNRLSGNIPSVLANSSLAEGFGDLNILRGNLFSCKYIPHEDEHSEDYICGSENLEFSLYSFLVLLALIFCLGICSLVAFRIGMFPSGIVAKSTYLFKYHNQLASFIDLSVMKSQLLDHLREVRQFSHELKSVTKLFTVILVINLIANVPLYTLKASEYGFKDSQYTTHSYQYLWLLSMAYMKGYLPTLLVIVVWSTAMFTMVIFVLKSKCESLAPMHTVTNENETVDATVHSSKKLKFAYAAIFLLNFITIVAINGTYIFFTNQALSPAAHAAIQLLLAFFKVGWNMAFIPLLVKPIQSAPMFVELVLLLFVFNNILIPCMVTVFTSPSCYQVRYSVKVAVVNYTFI